jgi:hypothetical protein
MNAIGIAELLGMTPVAFERLVRGEVPEVVANKIGDSTAEALQRFVEGETSVAVAVRLNCSEAALQELRDALGRQGAIGLLIGLCAPGPLT